MEIVVSVIIPSYNYRRFLKKRLASVTGQTFRDIEIIFIDDSSTDGSLEYAKTVLKDSGVPFQIIHNTENSGSVFAQWRRGFENARGRYIWFAEADDDCSPDFLETIMPVFKEYPAVGMVYSASHAVNRKNRIMHPDFFKNLYKDISPDKWDRDYINEGEQEIKEALSIMNTIPNASAVVMSRDAIEAAGGIPLNCRLSGDWYLYVQICKKFDIGFISEALNYNRIHSRRVTERLQFTNIYFTESIKIAEDIFTTVPVPDDKKVLYLEHFLQQWRRAKQNLPITPDMQHALYQIVPSDMADSVIANCRKNHYLHPLRERLQALTMKKLVNKCTKKKV